MGNIIPFPSYRVGLHPQDKVAVVVNTEQGRATHIKEIDGKREFGVFAHNDSIIWLSDGDLVRFERTSYGALIVDCLAKPGKLPLPRTEFHNGCLQINENDPAWRLYGR